MRNGFARPYPRSLGHKREKVAIQGLLHCISFTLPTKFPCRKRIAIKAKQPWKESLSAWSPSAKKRGNRQGSCPDPRPDHRQRTVCRDLRPMPDRTGKRNQRPKRIPIWHGSSPTAICSLRDGARQVVICSLPFTNCCGPSIWMPILLWKPTKEKSMRGITFPCWIRLPPCRC